MKQAIISTCEKDFILKAVGEGKRLDGRHTYDYRKIKVEFGNELGLCQVQLGKTRVLVQISSEVVVPRVARPSEGRLHLNVELSPMAAPNFEIGRLTEFGVEINRLLERCIVDSRALDVESLCIVAGEKVWAIRIDASVLNHDGNIMDCLSIATIAALAHFRRPDVTISGEEVTIHTLEEKNPVPLSLHHWPMCVTFAFFDNGKYLLVDPMEREERVMDGKTVLSMNIYREICTLHVGGTMSLHKEQILRCAQIAANKVVELVEIIKDSLALDTLNRSQNEGFGFVNLIEKMSIATANQDLEEIVIGKAKANANKVVEEGITKAKECLAREIPEEFPVIVEGLGTASTYIGSGGHNTWSVSDDDYSDDDAIMEISANAVKQPVKKRPCTIETVELSGDSEEETMVTLQAGEINQDRTW